MKTQQEIWDAIDALQSDATAQQSQINTINLLVAPLANLAWQITTVDGAGNVGSHTSLAFGPDGQPAISYFHASSADLKFARYDGSAWNNTTVDSAGSVGLDTSLAFGPDGQPAISNYDSSNGDLKFARKGLFPPAP